MCTLSVSNVIYHKFSRGAAFYTLNGKNVNVMLELLFASTFYVTCEVFHALAQMYDAVNMVYLSCIPCNIEYKG